MKISTKGRYALRMMIEFGLNSTNTTKINQVAKNQQISEKYLEQIASTLIKGKFIKSIRGAQGGYILVKDPKEYTVGDILRLTEGSLAPVYCLESNSEPCWQNNACVSKKVFKSIEDAINNVVDNITLYDLIEEEKLIRSTNLKDSNPNNLDIPKNPISDHNTISEDINKSDSTMTKI